MTLVNSVSSVRPGVAFQINARTHTNATKNARQIKTAYRREAAAAMTIVLRILFVRGIRRLATIAIAMVSASPSFVIRMSVLLA